MAGNGTTEAAVLTPTAKRSRKTEKAQAAPETELKIANEPQAEAAFDAQGLSNRLAVFGFVIPVDEVGGWTNIPRDNISRIVQRWESDFAQASDPTATLPVDRNEVPPLLDKHQQISPELQRQVQSVVLKMKASGCSSDRNPYPPGSCLAKIWLEAFNAAPAEAEQAETVTAVAADGATLELNGAVVQDAVTLVATAIVSQPSTPVAANEKREEQRIADHERQQQLAIEAAQLEMEEAVEHQAELEEQLTDMKSEMKELKSAFDNAGQRARKASRTLKRARAGIFERTLPFPKDKPVSESPTFESASRPKIAAAPAKPVAPPVDEGAFVSLDHMVKTDLQEFIPGTNEELGISQKQADSLKELVGGETIGDLEKWIKSKGNWWLKELRDSGKGFGEATVTKIQDVHEIIRRKFPIPDPDDVVETAAEAKAVDSKPAAAVAVPQASPADETVHEPMDAGDAEEALEELIEDCKEVERDITNQEGIRFVRSVKEQATSMIESLQGKDQTTPAQTRALRNWQSGVQKWLDTEIDEDDGFGDEIDEDEE